MHRNPDIPILLCTTMNGERLPIPHGGPLRVIIPGHIGARSVKWLTSIRLRATPSENFYMTSDYKVLPPQATPETKSEWMKRTPPLERFGLQAVIGTPPQGSCLESGRADVAGYAATGSGTLVSRVQVCAVRDEEDDVLVLDKAESEGQWREADREQDGVWSWCRWEVTLELSPGSWALVCRSESAAGERQPKLSQW
jgi:sulfite oxidase